MIGKILEIIGLVLFSSVKFLFAPSTVYLAGYSYLETIIITIAGGTIGVFVFFYLGTIIFDWIGRVFSSKNKKQKKTFSKKNRVIITIKNQWGVFGLALISPSLISIPLGCLLAAKYFRDDGRTIPALLGAVVFWSFTLTTITALIRP